MARMDSLKTISIRSSIGYGIAGGIAITLFYPSVFILAGMGITQITVAFYNKEWPRFRSLMFSTFLWLMIFVIVYAVYCRYMFYNGILSRGISPYPVWSLGKYLRSGISDDNGCSSGIENIFQFLRYGKATSVSKVSNTVGNLFGA